MTNKHHLIYTQLNSMLQGVDVLLIRMTKKNWIIIIHKRLHLIKVCPIIIISINEAGHSRHDGVNFTCGHPYKQTYTTKWIKRMPKTVPWGAPILEQIAAEQKARLIFYNWVILVK